VALVLAIVLALIVPLSLLAATGDYRRDTPRNVIFMVGDGFGPSMATLARVHKNHAHDNHAAAPQGTTHSQPMAPLHLDGILQGASRTYSANSLVTDSAAGATAFSCGLKTYNLAIGWTPADAPCGTIMEAAKRRGMLAGVVVTSSVTDATPAAFATHVPYRSRQNSIALQYATNRTADVILGGGSVYFDANGLQQKMATPNGGDTSGIGRSPYTVVNTAEELGTVTKLPLLGLFAGGHLPWEIDRPPSVPSLSAMTAKALELVSDASQAAASFWSRGRGFFLLIEGSKIDKAAHPNDAATMLAEIMEFDETVGKVLEFAAADGETLVVITADHETGGLTLARGVDTNANDTEAALRTRSFAAEASGAFSKPYAYRPEVRVSK